MINRYDRQRFVFFRSPLPFCVIITISHFCHLGLVSTCWRACGGILLVASAKQGQLAADPCQNSQCQHISTVICGYQLMPDGKLEILQLSTLWQEICLKCLSAEGANRNLS